LDTTDRTRGAPQPLPTIRAAHADRRAQGNEPFRSHRRGWGVVLTRPHPKGVRTVGGRTHHTRRSAPAPHLHKVPGAACPLPTPQLHTGCCSNVRGARSLGALPPPGNDPPQPRRTVVVANVVRAIPINKLHRGGKRFPGVQPDGHDPIAFTWRGEGGLPYRSRSSSTATHSPHTSCPSVFSPPPPPHTHAPFTYDGPVVVMAPHTCSALHAPTVSPREGCRSDTQNGRGRVRE
jgi:hypothetical protein